jgi:DNA-directed RNA polymerase specialized sigma24 family protein
MVAPTAEADVDQRALIERAQRGDHDAFAELFDPALARLDAAARLIPRDRELARDAVQEAFIRAWRDVRGLRDPERFNAWLYRLTVNACLAEEQHEAVLIDPFGGLDETVPWSAIEFPDWQRLPPTA